MYLDFYNLRQVPFAISCDDRFFYESSVHTEALANMMYTVEQRKGMVLVTGEVGAGKTFVGNVLGNRLGVGCLTISLKNPPTNGKQLLRAVCNHAGMSVRASADKLSLLEELEGQLVRLHSRGRLVALILDEAQDLGPSSLEELRLLWNWEYQGQRLVQIVLIGQPELRAKLQEPRWEPLRQRIVLSYHLAHLPPGDVGRYIAHRLAVAGESQATVTFTSEAVEEITAATGGTPRMINVLCDNALLVGFTREQRVIDRALVQEVLRDMTCWGLTVPQVVTAPQESAEDTIPIARPAEDEAVSAQAAVRAAAMPAQMPVQFPTQGASLTPEVA